MEEYIGDAWLNHFFNLPLHARLLILSKLPLSKILNFHIVAALACKHDRKWIVMFENPTLWKFLYANYFPDSRFKDELPAPLKTTAYGLVTQEYLTRNRKRHFPLLSPCRGIPSLKPIYGRETKQQEKMYNELMKWRSFFIFSHYNLVKTAKKLYQSNYNIPLDDIRFHVTRISRDLLRYYMQNTPYSGNTKLIIDYFNNPNNDELKRYILAKSTHPIKRVFVSSLVHRIKECRGDLVLLLTHDNVYSQLIVPRYTDTNEIDVYSTKKADITYLYTALVLRIYGSVECPCLRTTITPRVCRQMNTLRPYFYRLHGERQLVVNLLLFGFKSFNSYTIHVG